MSKNNKRKKKRPATQNKNSMKPLIWITAGFVAVLVLMVVLSTMQNNTPQDRFDELPSLDGQPILGDESAPVTVIGFGDYMCPTCLAWDKSIFPQLKQDYIDNGAAKFVHINTPFHGAQSQLASLASETVLKHAPEYFWDYHEAIFDAQAQYNHGNEWVSVELLLDLAAEHVPGIDLEQFEQDLTDQTALPELMIDVSLVERYNVTLTPTIMINGLIVNGLDYNEIKDTIDKELEAIGQ